MHFPVSQELFAGTDFTWDGPGAVPALHRYPARCAHQQQHRPVLLIHGFRGDHHGLSLIAHELRTLDAYVPDLPGFGRTPPPTEGLSLDFYAEHISALSQSLADATGRAPLLIGHSFGSVLAAHAFARRPERAAALGLLSPIVQPPLEGSARFLTQLTRLYYAAGTRLPERAGTALLAHPLIVRAMSEVMATTGDRHLRAFIHRQHALHFSDYSDRSSLRQAYEISIRHTVAEAASGIASAARPVLVAAGDADLIAPIEATRGFAAHLRREMQETVEAAELPGAGHLIHYERPLETAEAIMAFAARI